MRINSIPPITEHADEAGFGVFTRSRLTSSQLTSSRLTRRWLTLRDSVL